jgi:predicted Zn-dependent peptidase
MQKTSGYQKTILDNGIIVLSEHINHVRSIAIGVWIQAGSRDEDESNRGIAHFLEHILFKGTKTRDKSEIAYSLESLGGSLNAFTSKDYTCFYARALCEHLAQAIDILADIIQNPAFPEEEIEKEKQIVIDEINDVRETPSELIFEKFYENLFPNHPLGYSILGNKKDVKSFTKQACEAFMAKNYTAPRTIIAASGYLEHKELVKYAKKYFKMKKEDPHPRISAPLPEITQERKEYILPINHQTHLCTGIRTFPFNDEHRLTLLMLNAILSGGMSSRLFQNIREKHGIAYDIHSFTDFFYDTGCFGIYAATTSANHEKCFELIKHELNDLVENPVTNSELAITKTQFKSSLVMGLESTSARMNRLATQYMYLNEIDQLDKVIEKIDRVVPEDIQKLAQELFSQNQFITTILKAK